MVSFLSTRANCNSILSSIILVFLFILPSWQQKDPVKDFCRRFGHQSAVIDRKLYLDGGFVNWNPISQNPANYSNTWLLYNDLDVVNSENMPQLYGNLSKNGTIPDVSGGVLWPDTINKRFYLFGGEYSGTPPDSLKLLSYDPLNNQWDNFGQPATPINRVSWGAGVSISERGEAYYYGGWLSNASVPGWTGPAAATNGLIKYNMDSNTWTNNTGPDSIPRAEGVMVYLPASDGGMLVYFGGISTPYGNNTMVGMPMSTILIYDIAGGKWYNQSASGDVPDMRRRFCAGATWAQDRSSYNIYLYGGAGVPPDDIGFDDVYILSIPSFTWIKWYPTTPGIGSPHGQLTCNVIDGAQMLIIGGTFPLSDDCDAPSVAGTHNLNLGKQNVDNAMWYQYLPNITSYEVPSEIISQIGGSSLGGATVTAPAAGWGNRDLPVLMTRHANIAVRTATRSIPTATSPASTTAVKLSTGAIVGIAVGCSVFSLAALLGCCLCIRRYRRKRMLRPAPYSSGSVVREIDYQHPPLTAHSTTFSYGNGQPYTPTPTHPYGSPYSPPAELATGSFPSSPHPFQPAHLHQPLHTSPVYPKYEPAPVVISPPGWNGTVGGGNTGGYVERFNTQSPRPSTRSPREEEGWSELSGIRSSEGQSQGGSGGESPYSSRGGILPGQRMSPGLEYESIDGMSQTTSGRPIAQYQI